MLGKHLTKHSGKLGSSKRAFHGDRFHRRACFEPLETRQLLSVTLPVIGNQLVQAGAPLNVALNATGTSANDAISYSVTVNNSTTANPSLSYSIPSSSTFLKLQVDDAVDNIHGSMVFELYSDLAPHAVQVITNLVNQGYYTGLDFHRVIQNFMVQGGGYLPSGTQRDPTAAPYNVTPYANEISDQLKFTSSGVLALANTGQANSNTSQFFVTSGATRFLDGGYTIFGMLVEGEDIREAIAKVPVHTASGSNDPSPSSPNNSVIITSASIITDTHDAVLRLSSPTGSTGTATVTVKATDMVTNETTTRTFTVYVQPDVGSSNHSPALTAKSPSMGSTTRNAPITINISSLINQGDTTTGITDADPGSPIGGIAITALTGSGTWKYSLDGTNFVTVANSAVSATSALLLSKDAKLLYTPDGQHIEAPSVTYFAWDMSFGADGTFIPAKNDANYAVSAFSTVSDTATLAVVNQAPVLTSVNPSPAIGPTLGSTTKDQAFTFDLTSFINHGAGTTTITDADASDTVGGLAIQYTTGLGQWAYSLDGGSNWVKFSVASISTSVLLPKTAKLRYTPDGKNSDTAIITYNAWDMTTGKAGDVVDLSSSASKGGSTAFSKDSDSAQLFVNDAPVLTPAASSPSLGKTDVDKSIVIALTKTFINNGTGTTIIADPDQNDNLKAGSIAIVGVTGLGTWEYQLTATGPFQSLTSVSTSSALILSKVLGKLRYTPNGTDIETPTITYVAWDTTSGTNGTRVDLSQTGSRGGTTAYSDKTDTATLTVTGAPALTPASPNLGSILSNTPLTKPLTSFINNGDGTTKIVTTRSQAVAGAIAIVGIVGNGKWEYSLDNGATYNQVSPATSPISDTAALLLPKDALLRYTPVTGDETASITFRAWDTTTGQAGDRVDLSQNTSVGVNTAFSLNEDTATIIINNAPVLTPANPSPMGTTTEDAKNAVIPLTSFINAGNGTTLIEDSDTTAVVGGIAVTAFTGRGTWEYTIDNGVTYVAIDTTTVSKASALLLPHDAKLRYTPDGKNGESATITYYAWDTTTGTSGGRANLSDPSAVGGATAFSSASDNALLVVTDVNDAPVLTPAAPFLGSIPKNTEKVIDLATFTNKPGMTTITDVDQGAVIGGIAVVGITGSGAWEYSLDGTTYLAISSVSESSALLLPKTAKLRYTSGNAVADEKATITYHAWDASSGSTDVRADLTQTGATGGITPFSTATDTASIIVNDAPVLAPAQPSLGTVANTSPTTIPLTGSFINHGNGTTTITDPNISDPNDAKLGSIALIGVTGSGTWAYTLNGTDYVNIDQTKLGPSSALLLPKTASLRYTPKSGVFESATISYYAWDATTGTAGGTVDLSADASRGGATAFSTLSDTASLTVRTQATDITLTLTNGNPKDNLPVGSSVGTFAAVDPAGGGIYTYSLVSGTGSTDNGSFTLDGNTLKTAQLYNAGLKGSYTIRVRTTDQVGLSFEKSFVITLTDVTPPTVTINQQVGQPDPTYTGTIYFVVTFSEPVSDFTAADVTISGTAPGAVVKKITGSGMNYEVQVGGMTDSGTVTATIAAGKAHDPAGNANLAATSTDNTVTYTKHWAIYAGTVKDDTFVFSPGVTPGTWQLMVNSKIWIIPAGQEGITIDGLGGNDTVKVVGTDADETFEIWQDHIHFTSGNFEVQTTNIESFNLDGGGGKNTAIVHDRGTAPDVFEMGPGWVTMNGNSVSMANVSSCTVAATPGSKDTIRMYVAPNSQGKNSFTASPTSATMTMPGYTNTALNAGDVQAYTIPGGGDSVTFTDSAGDDILLASGIGAELFGTTGGNHYDVSAWGFIHFSGTSTGGNDTVRFYTVAGSKDSFVASPTSADYTGAKFDNSTTGFEIVEAYADPNTDSTATLFGSSSASNHLVTSPLGAQLNSSASQNSVWSFRHIIGQSGTANDTADMYGSAAADTLTGAPTNVSFSGTSFDRQAVNFSQVNAHGSAEDTATFHDTATSPMNFVGRPTTSSMTGTGFNTIASGFGNVQAYTTSGNTGTATFYDSATGTDSFTGSSIGAQMVGAGYNNSAWNFHNVQSYSSGGHDVAYLFGASSGTNHLAADKNSAAFSNTGFSNTVNGFETVNVSGDSVATDSAIFDNVFIESGHTTRALDGAPYNHRLYLNNFDDLSTTATPNDTTPTPHAVDQVMTAYWP